MRTHRWSGLAILLAIATLPQVAVLEAQNLPPDELPAALQHRNAEFLAAVDTLQPRLLRGFFPKSGSVTHRQTIYSDSGRTVSAWRFAADEIASALDGPLWEILTVQQEQQPIGLFAHQVSLRGTGWTSIGEYRFVPPGGNRCSAVYVRWTLEDGEWVVAEIADERFRTDRLPAWCC